MNGNRRAKDTSMEVSTTGTTMAATAKRMIKIGSATENQFELNSCNDTINLTVMLCRIDSDLLTAKRRLERTLQVVTAKDSGFLVTAPTTNSARRQTDQQQQNSSATVSTTCVICVGMHTLVSLTFG